MVPVSLTAVLGHTWPAAFWRSEHARGTFVTCALTLSLVVRVAKNRHKGIHDVSNVDRLSKDEMLPGKFEGIHDVSNVDHLSKDEVIHSRHEGIYAVCNADRLSEEEVTTGRFECIHDVSNVDRLSKDEVIPGRIEGLHDVASVDRLSKAELGSSIESEDWGQHFSNNNTCSQPAPASHQPASQSSHSQPASQLSNIINNQLPSEKVGCGMCPNVNENRAWNGDDGGDDDGGSSRIDGGDDGGGDDDDDDPSNPHPDTVGCGTKGVKNRPTNTSIT